MSSGTEDAARPCLAKVTQLCFMQLLFVLGLIQGRRGLALGGRRDRLLRRTGLEHGSRPVPHLGPLVIDRWVQVCRGELPMGEEGEGEG